MAIMKPRENALNRRIRRMVRDNIKTNIKPDIPVEGLNVILDKDKPLVDKTVWAIVLLACSIFCVAQFVNRISYYLTYPIAVDVMIEYPEYISISPMTFCASDTDEVQKFQERYKRTSDGKACFNPLLNVLKNEKNISELVDVESLWNATKYADVRLDLKEKCFVSNRRCEQNSLPDNLVQAKYEDFPAGTCKTLFSPNATNKENARKLIFEVSVIKPKYGGCDTSVVSIYLHQEVSTIDSRDLMAFKSNAIIEMGVVSIMYLFLNRPRVNRPCVDSDEHQKCMDNCLLKLYKERFQCRLPFMFAESRLPFCNDTIEAASVYREATEMLMDLRSKECQCDRKCNLRASDFTLQYRGENETGFVYIVSLTDTSVTRVVEKLAYGLSKLFADFGGNLGLSVGLSVLSLVQVCLALLKLMLFRPKPKFRLSDPIYRKVHKIFHYVTKLPDTPVINHHNCSNFFKIAKILLLAGTAIASGLFLYDRLQHLYNHPTRMVIHVTKEDSLQFPSIIDCGQSQYFIKMKKKIAKKMKISWCDVDVLDLLSFKVSGNTLDSFWQKSLRASDFMNFKKEVGRVVGTDFAVSPTNMSHRMLPSGESCGYFEVGSHVIRGSSTIFGTLLLSNSLSASSECETNYRTMFFLSEGEEFPIIKPSALYYDNLKGTIIFRLKYLTLLNSPRRPCVSFEVHNKCQHDCLMKKLRSVINCSLPFFPDLHLNACRNSTEGKEARKLYLSSIAELDPVKHCACIQRCQYTIYEIRTFIEPLSLPFNVIMYCFSTNIVESLEEVDAYGFSELLCDIGGNLGMMLGFSMLSIPQLLNDLLAKLKLHTGPSKRSQI